eukprot:m.15748 g.15748  ORF g.15748 m.15748 type:complete len:326 (-) comp10728_c0_seq1:421-1398(-)
MEIGGGQAMGSGLKKLKWPVHNRHILLPNIHPSTRRSNAAHRDPRTVPSGYKEAFENDNVELFLKVVKNINQIFRPRCTTSLHKAAELNQPNIAKAIIAAGGNINARDVTGKTPLWEAAKRNHTRVMKVLLEEGLASIELADTVPTSGATPLHVAANEDKAEAVELLLSHGADINAKNLNYATPLVAACKRLTDPNYNGDAVMLLINKGANLDMAEGWDQDRNGQPRGAGMTALHYAAMSDRIAIVSLLLKHGATPDLREAMFYKTPFEFTKAGTKTHDLLKPNETPPSDATEVKETTAIEATEETETTKPEEETKKSRFKKTVL